MEISIQGKKIGVDTRFPLSFYYRIADQLIAQAKSYRDEQNLNDLSTTLTRYCRLCEVTLQHPSYSTYSEREKHHHNKIYLQFVKELENLKPLHCSDHRTQKYHAPSSFSQKKAKYCETAETKSRSFSCVDRENIGVESVILVDSGTTPSSLESLHSAPTISGWDINVHIVTQSSPSPILSCIENVPQAARVSHISVTNSSHGETSVSRFLQDLHISARLMEDFLELARDNTNKDLETCGVLGAFLKKGTYYVTTLIIPKQESTSSSCQALSEEEIYAIQDEHGLFPVGWMHTHPSQSCFMSSIDLHTHYSYQVMLPEAVAIVLAPTDTSRSYGIFRLTEPTGTTVLKECEERGFHPHKEPADGSPIYEDCSHIYINPNLRFEIFDLR